MDSRSISASADIWTIIPARWQPRDTSFRDGRRLLLPGLVRPVWGIGQTASDRRLKRGKASLPVLYQPDALAQHLVFGTVTTRLDQLRDESFERLPEIGTDHMGPPWSSRL